MAAILKSSYLVCCSTWITKMCKISTPLNCYYSKVISALRQSRTCILKKNERLNKIIKTVSFDQVLQGVTFLGRWRPN